MMKSFLLLVPVAVFAASLAFGQAGPKQKEKTKPGTTKAKKKTEKVISTPDTNKTNITKIDTTVPSGFIKRALFTTTMEDREPVGSVDSLSTANEKVLFFSEIVGLQGQTITHRWKHGGEVRAEVPIKIGGPRWRVFTSKKLLPAWTGEWIVEIVDAEGQILGKKRLVYYTAGNGD